MTLKSKVSKKSYKIVEESSSSTDGGNNGAGTNKPRNLLVTDANTPFTFSYSGRYHNHTSLTVHQTADEETWPGGALWDLGVLLAQVMVAVASAGVANTTITMVTGNDERPKSMMRTIQLPNRLHLAMQSHALDLSRVSIILELGCGVGLTGLVVGTALRAKLTLLTDLAIVVERVTQPNLLQNSKAGSFRTIGQGKFAAVPLQWGCSEDERIVRGIIRSFRSDTTSSTDRRKSKPIHTNTDLELDLADLVIIGDVAYQHKPGAPSHFDALLSTLLQFSGPNTVLVFGLRIRMPASTDLLDMLLCHFEELVCPPLRADEVTAEFAKVKHNMSIHFLRRKTTSFLPTEATANR